MGTLGSGPLAGPTYVPLLDPRSSTHHRRPSVLNSACRRLTPESAPQSTSGTMRRLAEYRPISALPLIRTMSGTAGDGQASSLLWTSNHAGSIHTSTTKLPTARREGAWLVGRAPVAGAEGGSSDADRSSLPSSYRGMGVGAVSGTAGSGTAGTSGASSAGGASSASGASSAGGASSTAGATSAGGASSAAWADRSSLPSSYRGIGGAAVSGTAGSGVAIGTRVSIAARPSVRGRGRAPVVKS